MNVFAGESNARLRISGRSYAIALERRDAAAWSNQRCADRSALVITDNRGKNPVRVGRFGNCDGQFEMAHDLALGPDGAVYVGDITAQHGLAKSSEPSCCSPFPSIGPGTVEIDSAYIESLPRTC